MRKEKECKIKDKRLKIKDQRKQILYCEIQRELMRVIRGQRKKLAVGSWQKYKITTSGRYAKKVME